MDGRGSVLLRGWNMPGDMREEVDVDWGGSGTWG